MKECPNQPVVLTNPFPTQQKQVIAQNTPPPLGGNLGNLPQGAREIRMPSTNNLHTRTKTYNPPTEKSTEKEPPFSHLDIPLNIENPPPDIVIKSPKSTLQKTTHNPNARETQQHSIVEDLAQAPCIMSALEVVGVWK